VRSKQHETQVKAEIDKVESSKREHAESAKVAEFTHSSFRQFNFFNNNHSTNPAKAPKEGSKKK